MDLRYRRQSARGYDVPDRDLDILALRIRRLVMHRGFDRAAITSPLLKRQLPQRPAFGAAPEVAELRLKLKQTGLDTKSIAYLIDSAEAEIDLARLRLT